MSTIHHAIRLFLLLSLLQIRCHGARDFSTSCELEDAELEIKGSSAGGAGSAAGSSSSSSEPACPAMLHAMRHASREQRDGPLTLGMPTPCAFRWFSPAGACSLLSEPPTTFVFIGDSITRHFMHAMQLLLRGDLRLGALREDLPANVTVNCTCNRQFAVRACRSYILKDTKSLKQTPHPCPAARVVYLSATDETEFNLTQLTQFVTEEGQRSSVVLCLGGWGLHNGIRAKPVFRDLMQPVWKALHQQPGVQLLCLGIHSLQDNVLPQHKHIHNNANVETYNRQMHALCSAQGLAFFDMFAITANATSYDGIHYGILVNVLKAQLLLNWRAQELVEMQNTDTREPVSVSVSVQTTTTTKMTFSTGSD